MESKAIRRAAAGIVLMGIIAFSLSFFAYTVFLVWVFPILFLFAVFLYFKERNFLVIASAGISLIGVARLLYILYAINIGEGRNYRIHYYLPESYNGWAVVKFGRSGFPELKKAGSNGFKIMFDSSGTVETSSSLFPKHEAQYYLYAKENDPQSGARKLTRAEVSERVFCEQGNERFAAFYFAMPGLTEADSVQILRCMIFSE